MGHPCGYFLGTSFSKICNFNREFKTKSFRGRISITCRSSVAAIYQNKPLSPVSFFNCRNGLLSIDISRSLIGSEEGQISEKCYKSLLSGTPSSSQGAQGNIGPQVISLPRYYDFSSV